MSKLTMNKLFFCYIFNAIFYFANYYVFKCSFIGKQHYPKSPLRILIQGTRQSYFHSLAAAVTIACGLADYAAGEAAGKLEKAVEGPKQQKNIAPGTGEVLVTRVAFTAALVINPFQAQQGTPPGVCLLRRIITGKEEGTDGCSKTAAKQHDCH
jgi:hypothetical protein